MPEVFVTKADGTKQLYDKNKVVKTCLKMGASQKTAEEIAHKIENRAYEGISTKKILQMIFIFMRRYKPTISNVYDLRTGISVMSPKPEFELFVRTLLENHGFKVEPNQILIGKCTTHEVDAIARKDANTYFIEAKHHQSYHSLTGLDESRIARAIFEDITESYEIGKSNLKIDRAMLITNTRFSYQAVQYGNCRNILQIGWNEPKGFSLQKLIEEKKLFLEDNVLDILDKVINKKDITDQEWNNVKVKNLLRHDSGVPCIDCGNSKWLKNEFEEKGEKRATPQAVLSYLVKQKLQNKPGSQYQYNNNNYLILGRIIEQVTGKEYEKYVKDQILRPMGIINMKIGKTLKKDKDQMEVEYDISQMTHTVRTIFPEDGEFVSAPYGNWSMEVSEAYGGWIASAADIVRFVSFFDGFEEPQDLISKSTWNEMTKMPMTPYNSTDKDSWQGLAWRVTRNGEDCNYWHSGVFDETRAKVVRTADGYIWCFIFNGNANQDEVDSLMWLAHSEVKKIPSDDLASELFTNKK